MPLLSLLLSNDLLNRIHRELAAIPLNGFSSSLSELRHVRRVPLKADAATIEEEKHMAQPLDGLAAFHPVDIYDVNIQAYDGLARSLRKCQLLEGFGLPDGPKVDEYSGVLLDVSTFWMSFRLLYSFTGLAPILCDLFLVLGP